MSRPASHRTPRLPSTPAGPALPPAFASRVFLWSRAVKHAPATTGQKRCSACGEAKHVLAFASSQCNADGVQGHCRACVAAETHEWRLRTGRVVMPKAHRFSIYTDLSRGTRG